MRRAAEAGQSILIRTREGERFLFSKAPESPGKTFGEMAAQHAGSVASGIGDLSTNKKHLEGFGRARSSR